MNKCRTRIATADYLQQMYGDEGEEERDEEVLADGFLNARISLGSEQ